MAVGFRVKSGTLTLIGSDIDGWDSPAVQVPADDAPASATIAGCVLGATRYDTLGNPIRRGSSVVTISKKVQASPGRASATITDTLFDPAVESAPGGSSLAIGTSCQGQVVLSRNGLVGAPATAPEVSLFEDFPQVTGVGGIQRVTQFGAPAVTARAKIAPGGIDSSAVVSEDLNVAQQVFVAGAGGIASSAAFGAQRVLRGSAPSQQIAGAGGIPSALALGSPIALRQPYVLVAAGLSRTTAFGSPTVSSGAVVVSGAGGITSRVAFGTPGAATAGRLAPGGLPSSQAFGAPLVRSTRLLGPAGGISRATLFGAPHVGVSVKPVGIVTSVQFGTPRLVRQPYRLSPGGIPSSSAFGTGAIRTAVSVRFAGGIPSSSALGAPTIAQGTARTVASAGGIARVTAFGVPGLLPLFGPSEAFGGITTGYDVERAVVSAIRQWIEPWLGEIARQAGVDQPRPPKLVAALDQADWATEQQVPAVFVSAAPGAISYKGARWYQTTWSVEAWIVVSSRNRQATRRLSQFYAAAVRAAVTQDGALGIGASTTWDGEGPYVPATGGVGVAEATVRFSVQVDDALKRYSGLRTPPAPGQPPPGSIPVQSIDIAIDATQD